MNIAVTVNDNYIYPLYIMLNSLYGKHKGVKITVYLIHSRVSRENVEMLTALCEKWGGTLEEVYVGEDAFSEAPVLLYFTKEMYYRILVANLLPETEERVLYMDPDTIVTDSLVDFYNMPMGNSFFAGIVDRLQDQNNDGYLSVLNLKPETHYINSGILLCNLAALRREQKVADVFTTLKTYGETLKYPDQDLINMLYEDKIIYADDRYNLNPNNLFWYEFFAYNHAPFCRKKPAILHYMGKEKPWNPKYMKGLYHYYWWNEIKYTNRKKAPIFFRIFLQPIRCIGGWCIYFGYFLRRIKTGKK